MTYGGDWQGVPQEAMRVSLLSGLLRPTLAGPVNVVNAALLAKERGLTVFEASEPSKELLSLKVVGTDAKGHSLEVVGTLFQKQPRITRFNGFGMELAPEGAFLMTRHRDQPGVLGAVATWFGDHRVNISGLLMGQAEQQEGDALALFRIERPLNTQELKELTDIAAIKSARGILLE